MLEFIDKAQSWLDNEDRDYHEGVQMLLQMNMNKVLNSYLTRKRDEPKLMYEFSKWLDIMIGKLKEGPYVEQTRQEVAKMDEQLKDFSIEDKERKLGKREDHDSLPEYAIRAYENNVILFAKMRAVHERLKTMMDEKPCDRFPFLKELLRFDDLMRYNWDTYDKATPIDPNSPMPNATPLSAKEVSAYRKYLSDKKKKLSAMSREDESEKYEALLQEMQQKLNALLKDGHGVADKHLQELKALGLNVDGASTAGQ